MVLGNLPTQGYAKAMVGTFGKIYFGEAVVKRSALTGLRTRLVIACLGSLSLLRCAHNPKVGSSNLPPATTKKNAGILVIPAFFRIISLSDVVVNSRSKPKYSRLFGRREGGTSPKLHPSPSDVAVGVVDDDGGEF